MTFQKNLFRSLFVLLFFILCVPFSKANLPSHKTSKVAKTALVKEQSESTTQKQKHKKRRSLWKRNSKFQTLRQVWQLRKALKKAKKEAKQSSNISKQNIKSDKTYWGATFSFVNGVGALAILVTGFFLAASLPIYSFLLPFAVLMALAAVVTGIIGINKSNQDGFKRGSSFWLSLIGGVAGLLYLLVVAFVILVIASLSI